MKPTYIATGDTINGQDVVVIEAIPISEVYNMDCLEAMKGMKDKRFDLAIVDPPYGINAPKMSMGQNLNRDDGWHREESTAVKMKKGRLNAGSGKLKNRALNTMNCDWDYEKPSSEYFEQLFRVSKHQIIWGGNYFDLPPTRGIICWDKCQPWEIFSQWEMAWTSFDCPAVHISYSNTGGANAETKIHPTQKPVAVYRELYRRFAKQGWNILDTHLGSGSNRIAAYKMGFDFRAYEISKDYYEAQEKRFKEAINEPLLQCINYSQASLL